MAVNRRVLPHQGVHVRDCHENSDPSTRERLGDRELVKVAGFVVVNGRPGPLAQVAHVLGRPGRSADGRQLLLRRRREVRLQAALDHCPARDCGQGGPVGGLALENAPRLVARVGWVGVGWFHKILNLSFISMVAPGSEQWFHHAKFSEAIFSTQRTQSATPSNSTFAASRRIARASRNTSLVSGAPNTASARWWPIHDAGKRCVTRGQRKRKITRFYSR